MILKQSGLRFRGDLKHWFGDYKQSCIQGDDFKLFLPSCTEWTKRWDHHSADTSREWRSPLSRLPVTTIWYILLFPSPLLASPVTLLLPLHLLAMHLAHIWSHPAIEAAPVLIGSWIRGAPLLYKLAPYHEWELHRTDSQLKEKWLD